MGWTEHCQSVCWNTLFLASKTSEVKNDYAHVITQDICNKFYVGDVWFGLNAGYSNTHSTHNDSNSSIAMTFCQNASATEIFDHFCQWWQNCSRFSGGLLFCNCLPVETVVDFNPILTLVSICNFSGADCIFFVPYQFLLPAHWAVATALVSCPANIILFGFFFLSAN